MTLAGMQMKTKTKWSQADDALLIKLVRNYHGYEDIARTLEREVPAVKARLKKLGVSHPAYTKKRGIPCMKELGSMDERAYTSYGQRTTLDKLKPNQCHFPMFDNTGYCGAEGVTEKGYCQAHHDLCYRKTKKTKSIEWKHWKPAKC